MWFFRQNDIMTNREWHIFSYREHRWTEHTVFHRDIKSTDFTEPYSHRSLTPSPSPNGEGSDHRDTPACPPYAKQPISSYHQANRGNLTYYSPLHSERGWGWGLCEFCMPEAFCEFETAHQNVLLNLWVLWEKKLLNESRNCSFSHRKTQKNRTHSIPQRH